MYFRGVTPIIVISSLFQKCLKVALKKYDSTLDPIDFYLIDHQALVSTASLFSHDESHAIPCVLLTVHLMTVAQARFFIYFTEPYLLFSFIHVDIVLTSSVPVSFLYLYLAHIGAHSKVQYELWLSVISTTVGKRACISIYSFTCIFCLSYIMLI